MYNVRTWHLSLCSAASVLLWTRGSHHWLLKNVGPIPCGSWRNEKEEVLVMQIMLHFIFLVQEAFAVLCNHWSQFYLFIVFVNGVITEPI